MQNILDQPHTACAECVFASYHNASQIGCKLNKLDLYKNKKGVQIIEAEDEIKEFYLILGMCCYWHRGIEWANKNHYQDLEQKALNETQIKYDALVWAEDQNNEKVISTVNNILTFTHKPEKILVVNNSVHINMPLLAQWMNIECNIQNQKYIIKDIVDKKDTIWSAISRGARDCNSMFLYMVEAGQTIDNEAMKKINNKLFNELDEFAVIKFDYNSCLCLKTAYDVVGLFEVNFLSELYNTMNQNGFGDKFKTYKQYICQE